MSHGPFDVSRRKLLAGLATIGAASAGASSGTIAYFSDEETFADNQLVAGSLDLKVASTNWYSDWSEDEADHIEMADPGDAEFVLPAPPDQPDARDIAFDLTGPDEGQPALRDLNENEVNGGVYGDRQLCGDDADADGQVVVDLADVKPGDWGIVGFHLDLCDNPGYVWLTGGATAREERGTTDPEADDPDERDGVVELLDAVQVAVFRDLFNQQLVQSGQLSLRTFLELIDNAPGYPLIGDAAAETGGGTGRDCFTEASAIEDQNEHDVFVVWWLPVDHANQIQTDRVEFSLGFYAEQCRHNDGRGPERALDDAAVGGIDVQDGVAGPSINPPGTYARLELARARYTGPTDTLANAPPPIKQNAGLVATLNDDVPTVDLSEEYFVVGLHTPGVGSGVPTLRDSLVGVAALPTDPGEYEDLTVPVAPTPFTGSGFPPRGQTHVVATLWHGPVAPKASGITGPITDGDNDPYTDAAVVQFPST